MYEEFDDLEPELRAMVKWLGVALAILLALAWVTVDAAPRAENATECRIAAGI